MGINHVPDTPVANIPLTKHQALSGRLQHGIILFVSTRIIKYRAMKETLLLTQIPWRSLQCASARRALVRVVLKQSDEVPTGQSKGNFGASNLRALQLSPQQPDEGLLSKIPKMASGGQIHTHFTNRITAFLWIWQKTLRAPAPLAAELLSLYPLANQLPEFNIPDSLGDKMWFDYEISM